MERKIIHVDMDAFFASVEQRDNPSLKNLPVVVGAGPNRRGVVAAASYEARKYGIHSAMPSTKAYHLCPQTIFLPPRFAAYRAVSQQLHEIFKTYTDKIEPLSLDEAYLDVTKNKKGIRHASVIAKMIRNDIFLKTQLTASAGVSFNKFLAKIASDVNKPNGMKIIRPAEAEMFIAQLPIAKFYGIGPVTTKKMHGLGIHNGQQLKQFSLPVLQKHFGKSAVYYFNIARGIDDREVCARTSRKSVAAEHTFLTDIIAPEKLLIELQTLCTQVVKRMTIANYAGKTLTLKLRTRNFQTFSKSKTLPCYCDDPTIFWAHAKLMLQSFSQVNHPIRLLGLGISNLVPANSDFFHQPCLPF